jgi:NTE family protein
MYAATLDPVWIENKFREFMNSALFSNFDSGSLIDGRNRETFLEKVTTKIKQHYMVVLGLNKSFVASRELIEKAVEFLVPCDNFEELQIPTKVLATDIQTGNEIVYEEGNLKEAIIQSSSIPGFFEATFSNDKIIVDGGVSAPIPIEILRKYSKKVMAVDITNNELKPLVNPNMIEIMRRADIITSLKLKAKLSKEADILVKPDVSGIYWSDFNNFDKLLDSGRDAMTKVLDNLKSSETSKKNKLYNLFESAK